MSSSQAQQSAEQPQNDAGQQQSANQTQNDAGQQQSASQTQNDAGQQQSASQTQNNAGQQSVIHSPMMQQQPVGQPTVSTGSVLAQVSSVLAAIILLILACAWLAKRLGFTPKTGKRGQHGLSVSASCQVGQRERVVIVDVEDARLVLGVTAQQITHLHTLPPSTAQENPEEPPPRDFRQVLELIKRAGKPK